MHCKLYVFIPKICCSTSVSYSQDRFCVESYLVCPISYSVLFQWRLKLCNVLTLLSPLHQSTDLWGHKWSCEPWGPALAPMRYWIGASVFSMWQNQLLGTFRLLCLRAFYSMNALTCFDKHTVLIKASEFCFYSLMKALLVHHGSFHLYYKSEMNQCRPSFIATYIYVYTYIDTCTHTYMSWACACVYGLLCGKLSKYKAREPMPLLLLLF